MASLEIKGYVFYRKSFIKPHGDLFISTTFEGRGGVFEGGWGGSG